MSKTNLAIYDNSWYRPGGSVLKRVLWLFINAIFFKTTLAPVSKLKVALLRLFGAKIGVNVEIKPCVNIKYPWHLTVGDYTWIGENVWIDNLTQTTIGSNVCISQGAMLLTGNHNYKNPAFDLIVKGIIVEDGAWIGAHAVVCPGVKVGSHSVLAVGSIATGELLPNSIYQGNPARKSRTRTIGAVQ